MCTGPRADIYEVALQAGHFGLVVGSAALRTTWPVVADWTRWADDEGSLPESVRLMEEGSKALQGLLERAHGAGSAFPGGSEWMDASKLLTAFDVRPGEALYLEPKDRVRVW